MQIRRLWPCAVALALMACSKEETPPPAAKGDGTVKAVSPVVSGGMAFRLPFDAALSPDGKTAYFTALVGDGAALFKSPVGGGTPTKLADLVGPGSCDVASDGSAVLVADPGVESSTGALGAIVSVSASGGAPSVLIGTAGTVPQGIAVSGSRVVFAGVDPSDGLPGVFQTSVSGGLSTLQKTGLIDPSGVTVASTGEVYVLDAESAGSSTRRIVKLTGGGVTQLVGGLRVGYPAGIALAQDGNHLLVASSDPATGKARLERFDLSGTSSGAPATTAIGGFDEPAGLHRAAQADTYAYVDSGADSSGTVFDVNPL
jgi:hypothetical protein